MTISKAALAVMAKINKEYGEGALVTADEIHIARRYPTGSLSLDVALGGGLPANQPIEVIGLESHGKTATVLKTLATNMRLDPEFTVLWVAAEHYDTDQASALGVDNERVIVHSTQAMEEAFDVILAFGKERAVDAIVLDSYPALSPDEEDAKDMDDVTVAAGARLFGKFLRKWGRTTRIDPRDPDVKPILGPIIINQWRDKIGAWSPQGTPKTSPGGNAKNYFFYVRLEAVRDGWIEENIDGVKVKVGQSVKVKTIKNKSAAPQQVAVTDFYFRDAPGHGMQRGDYDSIKDIGLMSVLFKVIEKRGGWFSFANGELDASGKPKYRWQGYPAYLASLREDVDLQEAVTAKVYEVSADPSLQHGITEEQVDAAASTGTKKVARRSTADDDA